MKAGVKWGENGVFCSSLFFMKTTKFLSLKGKQRWILNKGYDVFMSLQEITFLAIKLFLEDSKNGLATIWYDKFYWWLTVAPLGDGAFLKASRTSDLHSLEAD